MDLFFCFSDEEEKRKEISFSPYAKRIPIPIMAITNPSKAWYKKAGLLINTNGRIFMRTARVIMNPFSAKIRVFLNFFNN